MLFWPLKQPKNIVNIRALFYDNGYFIALTHIVFYFIDRCPLFSEKLNLTFELKQGCHERSGLDFNWLGYVNNSLLVRLVFQKLTQSGSKQHDVIYHLQLFYHFASIHT